MLAAGIVQDTFAGAAGKHVGGKEETTSTAQARNSSVS